TIVRRPGTTFTTIGSDFEDRRRVMRDVGRCGTAGSLIRSSSTLTAPLPGASDVRWAGIAPTLDLTWNSAIPFSMNDGAMWAGRGVSASLLGGVRAELRRVAVTVAPRIIYEQNRGFPILASRSNERSDL